MSEILTYINFVKLYKFIQQNKNKFYKKPKLFLKLNKIKSNNYQTFVLKNELQSQKYMKLVILYLCDSSVSTKCLVKSID